jgi:hypothetical protein
VKKEMKMKLVSIALAATILLGGCSVYSPDAGHEVVLVEKPWFLGHGGVDAESVKTGRTYAAISTDGVTYICSLRSLRRKWRTR